MPKLEKPSNIRVSPLCDVEILPPDKRWEPGLNRGRQRGAEGSKFLEYVKSKKPGLEPYGWRDITPYWGKGPWPISLSSWRTQIAKHGYYISVKIITVMGQEPYRGIFVCLRPTK